MPYLIVYRLILLFTPDAFRAQFSFLRHHPDWVYLDNAATMHKPDIVLQATELFYQHRNSNVHRGAHQLSQQATMAFEQARSDIAAFINARSTHEIIFTSGATAALNQIAFGLMHTTLKAGDRILLTAMEHHANIVPWQIHCQKYGVILDVVPLTENLQLDLQAYEQLLQHQPKVVSLTHISNVLGHINPIADMVTKAKQAGAITVIDGAQGIVHDTVDVQQLDVDFYVFSGHKLYGPTGTGILYGKEYWLEKLAPLNGGGEMISEVSFHHTSFNQLPFRLEAGTPNISGVIGLATAVNWLKSFDRRQLIAHKQKLLTQFFSGLAQINNILVLSQPFNNAGIVALNIGQEHPSDVAALLDQQHIAVRAGQHCAMPLFESLSLPGAVRFSFAPYNTAEEVNRALSALEQTAEVLTA